jgi:hypothetical protein
MIERRSAACAWRARSSSARYASVVSAPSFSITASTWCVAASDGRSNQSAWNVIRGIPSTGSGTESTHASCASVSSVRELSPFCVPVRTSTGRCSLAARDEALSP